MYGKNIYLSQETVKALQDRLSRIEGHVRGVSRMLGEHQVQVVSRRSDLNTEKEQSDEGVHVGGDCSRSRARPLSGPAGGSGPGRAGHRGEDDRR
ncbi:MAG: metal-sensing transcriptional repressor [Deinococcus sp.]|nr:metal-sensing transcriptional repressor [Deinococcus sp.]